MGRAGDDQCANVPTAGGYILSRFADISPRRDECANLDN
jgi:hypothetical protein